MNGSWSFSYDSLNRLATATGSQPGNPYPDACWQYDNYGNRLWQTTSATAYTPSQNGGLNPCPAGSGPSSWAQYSTTNTNRIDASGLSYSYDAAGNVTSDGINSYLYDGEGRICAVQKSVAGLVTNTQYLYDAEGRRVAKGSISSFNCDTTANGFTATAVYVLGPGGEQMTEMAPNSSGGWQWAHTNVFAPGLSATYDADLTGQSEGAVYFHLSDWLGTRRQQTDYVGNPVLNFTGLPYGDELATVPVSNTNVADATEHHFTGKERDAESGLDYFGARYYGSSMGRMMSPDPFIPFNLKKDEFQTWISNPQHWNKYAYVLNNPLKFTDPTGLTETVYYSTNNLTDEQKKFFNEHKDAILGAIGKKLNEAGIKDVVFKDGASLSNSQVTSILSNNPKGVALLSFGNSSFGPWHPDSGTYGGTRNDNSVVLMGNLQAGKPDASTLIFRLGEVGSHELGHGMGFYSCFLCHWNPFSRDLMNESQGMPRSPEHFDMTIPQNKQAVDEINKLPVYNPQ